MVFPDNHSNQPDWHPDDITRTEEFCDMCVDVVRVHGTHVAKASGFSRQLERDSKGRVLLTVNNQKMRAEWLKGFAAAMYMLPQQVRCDLCAEYLSDFFLKWAQRNSQLMTAKRTSLWHHPAKPEGALNVALFIIQNYAYAGHGEIGSFDRMTDCSTL